jgi:hypothetical protein
MRGGYTCTVPYIFMAWCLVKYRDKFTLPYLYIVRSQVLVNEHKSAGSTNRNVNNTGTRGNAPCAYFGGLLRSDGAQKLSVTNWSFAGHVNTVLSSPLFVSMS